jgi:hypothetical protein
VHHSKISPPMTEMGQNEKPPLSTLCQLWPAADVSQPCVAGATSKPHSAAARCIEAGVGECWLAFAPARAEADSAGFFCADRDTAL